MKIKSIIGLSEIKSKYARNFPFKNQHPGKVKIGAVFFERMLTVSVQSEGNVCGVLSKKIASIGVWGNGRLPQLNIPSALAVAKQGYRFLFAYWDVLIAFIVGLMLYCFC